MKNETPTVIGGQQLAGPIDDFTDAVQDNFPGVTGRAATEGIIMAGYARNPQALRAAYDAGKPHIDAYLQQIDVGKAMQSDQKALQRNAQMMKGAAIGAGAAFLLSWIF